MLFLYSMVNIQGREPYVRDFIVHYIGDCLDVYETNSL